MGQAASNDFYFNPFDPEFRANPYPSYPALLEGPPRSVNLFVPTTLVARYDDVCEVLRDPARFSTRRPEIPVRQRLDPFGAPTVLLSDPPVHTRLRKLVSKAFTPRRVRELEPRIREIAAALLDRVKGDRFEAMADLANPLPVIVIAEMLGVSTDDHEQFKRWSNALISAFRPDAIVGGAAEEAIAAKDALRAYFAAEIEKRRVDSTDDLVGALVAARDEAGALSEGELLAFVVLLLLAGNETTTNLIGNGLLALCRHPGELERLRREPELIPSAVEEMLRFDPPVQMTARMAEQDTCVGGAEIPRNSMVFVLLAAANRDPRHFPNPERFDIARTPNEHLAFGEGIHFCLGAPLARLEGAIAIGARSIASRNCAWLTRDRSSAIAGRSRCAGFNRCRWRSAEDGVKARTTIETYTIQRVGTSLAGC